MKANLATIVAKLAEDVFAGLEQGDTADGEAVVAIVVVGRVNATTIEVQVVSVAGIVGRRGPVIAVAAGVT